MWSLTPQVPAWVWDWHIGAEEGQLSPEPEAYWSGMGWRELCTFPTFFVPLAKRAGLALAQVGPCRTVRNKKAAACKLWPLEWLSKDILLSSPGNSIWSLVMEPEGG